MERLNFTISKKEIPTYVAHMGNEITKDYYNFLVGEINRGTIFKTVLKKTNVIHNIERYYLISNI